MTRPLNEQVVVLIGASSGIGREAAKALAAEGARLVLAARDRDGLEQVAAEIRAAGGKAHVVPTDVTRPEQVERLANAAEAVYGRIDTWINDAGVALYASFEDAPLEDMHQVTDVVYWGQVHGIKAALPRLKAAGGTIICIGSIAGDLPLPLMSAYVAAKSALKGLFEAVRIELRHDQVPVSLVLLNPPSVDTPLFGHARTRLGVKPRPLPPVYDPAVIAREIVRNARSPRREVTISGAGRAAKWFHRFAPGLWERQQAAFGYALQRTNQPKSPEAPDNLAGPISGSTDVRGTGNGRKISVVMWLESHPAVAAGGLALAAGAATLWSRQRRG